MRKEMLSSEISTSYDFSEKMEPERAGFEPAVQTSHTQPFQGCSLSRSDTSPAYNCYKSTIKKMVMQVFSTRFREMVSLSIRLVSSEPF